MKERINRLPKVVLFINKFLFNLAHIKFEGTAALSLARGD